MVDNNTYSVLISNENYYQSQTNQILDDKLCDNVLGNNIVTCSYDSNEEFNIESSMRSLSSETGSSSTCMHELLSSINDASVNMQPPAMANVCTDNHIDGQDKSSNTDNKLIWLSDQSLSVTSFQVSKPKIPPEQQHMIYMKIIQVQGLNRLHHSHLYPV